MNKITLIGALGFDPELRSTRDGIPVCSFSVAVNNKDKEKTTTWFRVSAWRQLGEICARYLAKGRKVCVVGSVSCKTFQGQDGATRASLEVNADEVEFLSPMEQSQSATQRQQDEQQGFVKVDDEELPF